MNKKVRVAIIGAGNISRAHIKGYQADDRVKLVGVCDINLERAQKTKEANDMKYAFKDYKELLAQEDIDAVSVCTWNNSHAEITIAAAKAGKHVMCEKPMAMTAEEAQAMADAVKESGTVYVMGFTRRHMDQSKVITDFLNDGAFGEVYYAKVKEIRRRGTPLGWFTDKDKSGGGPIIDIGVHSIYTTWYMMGKPEPISVSAQIHSKIGDYQTKMVGRWTAFDTDDLKYTVEDSGEGMIRFDNGAVMIFENSWAINGEGSGMNVRIYGTKGGATLEPLKIYQEQNGYLLDAEPYINVKTDAFSNETAHFIDCILDGIEPITSAEDGIKIQKILNGIYKSAELGEEVKL